MPRRKERFVLCERSPVDRLALWLGWVRSAVGMRNSLKLTGRGHDQPPRWFTLPGRVFLLGLCGKNRCIVYYLLLLFLFPEVVQPSLPASIGFFAAISFPSFLPRLSSVPFSCSHSFHYPRFGIFLIRAPLPLLIVRNDGRPDENPCGFHVIFFFHL